jgi:arabinogalactan oligomer/maltooligosaccharide transport system permease protein
MAENIICKIKSKTKNINTVLKNANIKVKCSMAIMGLGQLLYKQWVKGFIYLAIEILAVLYFILSGGQALYGFITLGSVVSNQWYGIEGDNSVIMLIMGILALIILVLYIFLYISNIKDVYNTQTIVEKGKKPITFRQEISMLLNNKFHITVLFFPIIGVCIFNVIPIVFMILVSFTNYGGYIIPPALVDWVGFDNFFKIITLSQFASTFFKILSWNILWASSSTFLNYFAGLGLALLLNKKCVKGKIFWRAFPILAYAIPGFITMLSFKFMFSYGGPINQIITGNGGSAIGFLDLDAKWSARLIGLGVNAWITIPTSMLLATGVLANLNKDLFEAAKIDGATVWKQFIKITLPFVLFATMPVIINQFVYNFNNFGIFYFLRERMYIDGYFLANDTDLLINWLYNLSIDNNYYSIGATVSLFIFIITSIISLAVYVMSPSYKQEDTFR